MEQQILSVLRREGNKSFLEGLHNAKKLCHSNRIDFKNTLDAFSSEKCAETTTTTTTT